MNKIISNNVLRAFTIAAMLTMTMVLQPLSAAAQTVGAPVIQSFSVTDLGTDHATLNVGADQPVTVQTSYWPVATNGGINAMNAFSGAYQLQHQIPLTNLSQNTNYQARLTLANNYGATTQSNIIYFTTAKLNLPDTTNPIVSNVVANASNNWATITWNTDEPTTSLAWYHEAQNSFMAALSSADNKAQNGTVMSTSHSVTITGLQASTRYLLHVGGYDAAGNLGQSAQLSFTTQATSVTPPPVTNNGLIVYNTSIRTTVSGGLRYAYISWKTSSSSDSTVVFSTSSDYTASSRTAYHQARTMKHEIKLQLNRKTYYYYRAQSRDAQGNTGLDTGVIYLP